MLASSALILLLSSSLPSTEGSICGDRLCSDDETAEGCPVDCVICGDGICSVEQGEDFMNCVEDCDGATDGMKFSDTDNEPSPPKDDGCNCAAERAGPRLPYLVLLVLCLFVFRGHSRPSVHHSARAQRMSTEL